MRFHDRVDILVGNGLDHLRRTGKDAEMEIPSLMKCPMCGTNNDSGGKICSCCSFELDNEYAADLLKEKAKQKRARLFRILNIIAAVLMFGMSYYAIFVSASAGLFATIIYVIAAIKNSRIKKAGGKPERSLSLEIAVLAVFVIHFILAFAWCLDAPPIHNDYTAKDLLYPGPEFDETWDLLNSLADKEGDPNAAPAIGLNAYHLELIDNISVDLTDPNRQMIGRKLMVKADAIEQLWEHSEKGRWVIRRLAEFDQLADLSESTLEMNVAFLGNAKELFHVYTAYACLQSAQGKDMEAIETLVEFDGVFRKLSVNAHSLITKLVCYAVLVTDMQAANFIANDPLTSRAAIESLRNRFVQLKHDETTLENCFINEYLIFKNSITIDVSAELRNEISLDKAPRQFLKPNSTLRVYRNMVDRWIWLEKSGSETGFEELRVWPWFYPNIDISLDSYSWDKFPLYYKFYNPIGAMIIGILEPATNKVRQIKMRVLITDDLFQIVLAMRLGQTYSLEARAYSDEYTIDLERKLIYSPGRDGEPFTKDDIKLPINPEVLNLN